MPTDPNESTKAKSGKKFLRYTLFEIPVLAALLWLFFILASRALPKIAIAQIAEMTNTKIRTAMVNFNLDGSILIKGLEIRPDRTHKYDDTILKAKTVHARFGVGSLLLLRPRLKEISINNFIFSAIHDLDTNQWNLAALKIGAPKGDTGKIPVVKLKKGTLRYSKVSGGRVKVVAAIPLDAKFGPAKEAESLYRFEITTATMLGSFGKSNLKGYWKPGEFTITGGISSEDTPSFERACTIGVLAAELTYDKNKTYLLKLSARDFFSKHRFTADTIAFTEPTFLKKLDLFSALKGFFDRYGPAGKVDIELKASGNLNQLSKSSITGKIYCEDVSICYRKFPYTIEHLTGWLDFTKNSVVMNNLCGYHNDVKLFFNGWCKNSTPDWQYQIQITSDNIALDKDLYTALYPGHKKAWSVFSPTGFAAIDYRASCYPQAEKKMTLAMELTGAEVTYGYFPYPLKNLTGRLFFDGNSVTISDVTSQSDKCEIKLDGRIIAEDINHVAYDISVDAKNIPLDSILVAALPQTHKEFFSRLDTKGAVSIENLTGKIWSSQKTRQLRYNLSLRNEQVEIKDDLIGILPSPAEKIVSRLQPNGKINLTVDLNKLTDEGKAEYKVTVNCLRDKIDLERFAYPLKDITGSLIITKDKINLQNITATTADSIQLTPDSSAIEIDGEVVLTDNSFSNGSFRFSANDIFLDERLGMALPKNIQDYYSKLSPTGRFDLDFENIKIFNDPNSEKTIDFTGAVKLNGCRFNALVPITDLNATLATKGGYKTSDGLDKCQIALAADSLRIMNKSLTAVRADIDYDRNQRSWLTKNFIADCYQGNVAGKLELMVHDKAGLEYILQTGFDNINLRQFLSDTKSEIHPQDDYSSGQMNCSLSVSGWIGDSHSRIGRCRMKITDMEVGKLSPMAKLLYVLELTEPTDFAFKQMLVDSYLEGDRLLLKEVDMSGARLAFKGAGQINLQNQIINLTLAARSHHRFAKDEPSVLQSLTEGLGQAVVRLDVTGNFYNPEVTTRTLPVIKKTLELIGTRPATQNQP